MAGRDHIEVKGVSGGIVNVASQLDGVLQSIGAASIPEEQKQQLDALVRQLRGALEKVPPEKTDDAGAVADTLKDTLDKVGADKPNKKSIEISAKGMVEAAKGIAEVLPIAMAIAKALAGLFGFQT